MIERQDLLKLCKRGFVDVAKWRNRDSSAAQRQLGECYALLKAGCDFTAHFDGATVWVLIDFPGFDAFEYGDRCHTETERFYVPTAERLVQVAGGDWY